MKPRDLAPLLIIPAVAPWLWTAASHYGRAELFDDVTALQYAGWCLLHGVRMYDGVALPDGPLAFALHAVLTLVAGTGAQAMRRLDLVVHALVGALGAFLLLPRRSARPQQLAWAAIGATFALVATTSNDFPSSCQRESYWVAFGSLALCLVHASAPLPPRAARAALFAAGLASGWLVFGKPTGALYPTFTLAAAALLPDGAPLNRRARLRAVGWGLAAACASMLAFVEVTGSLRGLYRWHLRYVTDVYLHDEPLGLMTLLHGVRVLDLLTLATGVLLVALAATAAKALPRHAIVLGAAPIAHLAAALAQRKGYEYQFIPVADSARFFCLFALVIAWVPAAVGAPATWSRRRWAAATSVLVVALVWVVGDVRRSPWLDPAQRHVDDPKILDERAAGAFVREHTGPSDLLLTFDSDARVALEARRRPALPELNQWMLDASAILASPARHDLSRADRETVERFQREVQADACGRIVHERPAAMVFEEGGPPFARMVGECDEVLRGFADEYRPAGVFGRLRVYLAAP